MLSFRQTKTCHTSTIIEESSMLLHSRSSGDMYSGQRSLANLTISEMSCVELMMDGTNEFIIDEYKKYFRFDTRAFARLQNARQEEPVIDLRRCGTCNIFNIVDIEYFIIFCVRYFRLDKQKNRVSL
jgi:hypothetical protein